MTFLSDDGKVATGTGCNLESNDRINIEPVLQVASLAHPSNLKMRAKWRKKRMRRLRRKRRRMRKRAN